MLLQLGGAQLPQDATLTPPGRWGFDVVKYLLKKDAFQIEFCLMAWTEESVRFTHGKFCSAAYGVASLRANRQQSKRKTTLTNTEDLGKKAEALHAATARAKKGM